VSSLFVSVYRVSSVIIDNTVTLLSDYRRGLHS
jgi:hypothetical protein